ncbi:MAG: hypothetical protein K6G64_06525 [Eubacterium sp.]|nr:hypothetical protein [Eubacterium sp.]
MGERKTNTSNLLVTIGVLFIGLSTYALLRAFVPSGFSYTVSVSFLVAFILILIKCGTRKYFFDTVVTVLILDSFAIALGNDHGKDCNTMLIVWTTVLILISIAYYFKDHLFSDSEIFKKTTTVILCFQSLLILASLIRIVFSKYYIAFDLIPYITTTESSMNSVFNFSHVAPFMVPFMILSLCIVFLLADFDNLKAIDISLESVRMVCIYCFVASMIYDLNRILGYDTSIVLFAVFTMIFALQIFFGNNVTLIVMIGISSFISFGQIISGTINDIHTVLPYAAVCALILLIIGIRDRRKELLFTGICQMIMEGAILFFAYYEEQLTLWKTLLDLTPEFVWFSIITFIVSFFLNDKSAVMITRSIGAVNIVLAMNTLTMNYIPIPGLLFTEWFSLSLLVGIVILTIIWYSEDNVTVQIQTIGLNLITLFLLSHTMESNTEVFCITIFTFYTIGIICYGILHDQKSFRMIGLCSLAVHSVKISKELWYAIPWWGYFLFTGILLITLVILYEKRGKHTAINTQLNEEL